MRNFPTQAEKNLWERLRDRKLDGFKFLRQHPILYERNGNDLRFFIPDFYCPEAKLIVELDGSVHNQTKEYDQWRDEILSQMLIKILRFTNGEVIDIEKVLDVIRHHLKC